MAAFKSPTRSADVSFSAEFQDVFADEDSEDDVTLAELARRDLGNDDSDEEDDIPLVNLVNPPVNFDTAYQHPWLGDFAKESGPLLYDPDTTYEPGDIIERIITPEVIEHLVQETNRYAQQYFDKHPKDTLPQYSYYKKWDDIGVPEMRVFLGILFYMGYIKFPNYAMYWNTETLTEIPGFRKLMSRNKFLSILGFLHVSNNDEALPREDPKHDKIGKIRPIMEMLREMWQQNFYPAREVSVDESIIAFKGRTGMMQYMPGKPHKWGIKGWVLAESKSGYMYNFDIYRGAIDGQREKDMTKRVVLDICKPVENNCHHVYMDNFFSSPGLFESLMDRRLGACGTLRANRQGVPNEIKDAEMSKGDPPISVRDGHLQFISWQDKKKVNVVSTIHNNETFIKTVRCKDAATNFQRRIEKPKSIELYNKFMGGVDLIDQKLMVYLSVHRTTKWWKKIFVYLMEVSFVNASIIWKALNPGKRFEVERFRLAVIKRLVGNHQREVLPSPVLHGDLPARRVGRHFITRNKNKTTGGNQAYPDCAVCSKRNGKRCQTLFLCEQCNVPMHPYPCHMRYHTMRDYKIICTKELHKS
jgi:hypothetical protein